MLCYAKLCCVVLRYFYGVALVCVTMGRPKEGQLTCCRRAQCVMCVCVCDVVMMRAKHQKNEDEAISDLPIRCRPKKSTNGKEVFRITKTSLYNKLLVIVMEL